MNPTPNRSARFATLLAAVLLALAATAGAEAPADEGAPAAAPVAAAWNPASALEPIQTLAVATPKPQERSHFPECSSCYGNWYLDPLCHACRANRLECNTYCGGPSLVATFFCNDYWIYCECNDGRFDTCDCYDC